MRKRKFAPTATLAERLVIAVSGVVAAVFFIMGLTWAGLLAFAPGLAAAVAQQLRENRARRAALRDLMQDLPAMSDDQRASAIEAHRRRYPAVRQKKELDRHVAAVDFKDA
jgi:hypothetical protein